MSLRLAVDLDGVILKYKTSKSFNRHENRMPYDCFGEPVPGVKEALTELRAQGWEIVVLSTRANRTAVWGLLRSKLKIPFDALVSPAKDLAYDAHLSTGGVRFTGNWASALGKLREFQRSGTWEEKRRRGAVEKGLHDNKKGFL